jgi:molecular chaperone GrpE
MADFPEQRTTDEMEFTVETVLEEAPSVAEAERYSQAAQAPAAPAAAPDAAVAEARAQVDQLRAEARDNRDRMLRLAADFENYKKRNERERQEYMRFANERLLREFLPVVDNMSRAVDAARKSGESVAIVAGIDLVLQEMIKLLKKYAVEPVPAVGQVFNPAYHEALQQVESEDAPPGTVVGEIQRGYTLNGRVLRPSLVSVAAAPEVTSPGSRIEFDS